MPVYLAPGVYVEEVPGSPPIVGVGPHSGDPHFDTAIATDMPIERGSFVLIDLWAKMDRPRNVTEIHAVVVLGESGKVARICLRRAK